MTHCIYGVAERWANLRCNLFKIIYYRYYILVSKLDNPSENAGMSNEKGTNNTLNSRTVPRLKLMVYISSNGL